MVKSGTWNLDGGVFLAQASSRILEAATTQIEKEFTSTVGKIIEASPVGIPNSQRSDTRPQGNFRHNWQIARKYSNRVLRGSSKKGLDYASKQISGKLINGGKLYAFNNSPQAKVIEFGGYPEPVKYGTYRKGLGYEIRSQGGYSKQAPQGIVRVNLLGFSQRYKARVRKALRGLK